VSRSGEEDQKYGRPCALCQATLTKEARGENRHVASEARVGKSAAKKPVEAVSGGIVDAARKDRST
jgi:hypothetical protein